MTPGGGHQGFFNSEIRRHCGRRPARSNFLVDLSRQRRRRKEGDAHFGIDGEVAR
jgi:hypothetical protein